MSNQSIREVLAKYSNFKDVGLQRAHATKLPPALENMCCEVYNAGSEEITFKSIHPAWHTMYFFGKPPIFWKQFSCKPGEWVFLPHGMYDPSVPSGDKAFKVVINVGDAMFKGNTLPSRPEAAKIRSFGGLKK